MSDTGQNDGHQPSPQEWQARREALARKLEEQKIRAGIVKPNPAGGMRGAADGMKLASEFVAGILAGAGIGYLLDRIAGTGPFGLIVFLILGFIAGVLNVLRSVGKTGSPGVVVPKDATNRENSPTE
jgi:ATP synthase protein I